MTTFFVSRWLFSLGCAPPRRPCPPWPRHRLGRYLLRAYQVWRLVVFEAMQLCLHMLVEIGKRKIDAASAVIPQHLCHAERVRAVRRRAVPVLVGKFLLLAGLEQDRQIGPVVGELLARSVIFLVRLGSKRHRSPKSPCRTVAARILRADLLLAEARIQAGKIPRHPHLLIFIPSQRTCRMSSGGVSPRIRGPPSRVRPPEWQQSNIATK